MNRIIYLTISLNNKCTLSSQFYETLQLMLCCTFPQYIHVSPVLLCIRQFNQHTYLKLEKK